MLEAPGPPPPAFESFAPRRMRETLPQTPLDDLVG